MSDKKSARDEVQGVRDAIIEASRVQLAAVAAAGEFWSSWAEFTATYSQDMSKALKQAAQGEADADELIAVTTDLNREYLRKLTELPGAAASRFDEEVDRIETLRGPRRRAAKAKS